MTDRPGAPTAVGERLLVVLSEVPRLAGRLAATLPGRFAGVRADAERRVRVAHWVGEMAVTYGRAEVIKRLGSLTSPSGQSSADTTPTTHRSPRGETGGSVTGVRAAQAEQVAGGPLPPLPFDGYDSLPASQIVDLLPRLPAVELQLVRDYETAHRRRRTVLGRIEQLLAT